MGIRHGLAVQGQVGPRLPAARVPAPRAVGVGAPFWLTVQLSPNEPKVGRQIGRFWEVWAWTALVGATIAGLTAMAVGGAATGASWTLPPWALLALQITLAVMALELVSGVIGFAVVRTRVASGLL